MASEGTNFFLKTESCFYTRTFKMLMCVRGCNDKPLPAGCPGEERRTCTGTSPVYSLRALGLGAHPACSCLPLPLGHFPNLATLLVKGFSGMLHLNFPLQWDTVSSRLTLSVVRSFLFRFCFMVVSSSWPSFIS